MTREGPETAIAPPQVFISYARQDAEPVIAIARMLEEAGATVWLDRERILGGQYFGEEIVHAIAHSRVLLVICSPHSFQSDNVQREVALTWDFHRRYLPVWITNPVEIPARFRYALVSAQWIDAQSEPSDRWLPNLLKALCAMGVDAANAAGKPAEVPRAPADGPASAERRCPRFRPGDRPIVGADWVLQRLLGKGGFGEVWKANNPQLPSQPPVALKFCLELEARAKDLLRHEADMVLRAQRQIHSEGIVALIHAYLNNDPPCLEYPYIHGGTLVRLLDECRQSAGSFSPAQVERIIHRIARIVGPAHRATPRLIHRDLKPSNVLVERRPDGKIVLRVTDFGIGAIAAQPVLDASRSSSSHEANPWSVLSGSYSPHYASPQQMRGEEPDPRDDVFALGVIWHQLLTGDLASPAPTGRRWVDGLRSRGMSDAALELMSSCFEIDRAHRPADATLLAEHIETLARTASAGEAQGAAALSLFERAPSPPAERAESLQVETKQARHAPHDESARPRPSPAPPQLPVRSKNLTRRLVATGAMAVVALLGLALYVATENEKLKNARKDTLVASRLDAEHPASGNPPSSPPPKSATAEPERRRNAAGRDSVTVKAPSKDDLSNTKVAAERAKEITASEGKSGTHHAQGGEPASTATSPKNDTHTVRAGIPTVRPDPEYVTTRAGEIKLKLIPAGEFMMGSDDSDAHALSDEVVIQDGKKQKHRVRITRPFYLGVTEVTRGQFRLFVDDEGYKTEAERDRKGTRRGDREKYDSSQTSFSTWLNPGFEQTEDHPVVNVSWNDAVAFCGWLSRREGHAFRLPTEAEWEYACRAGTSTRHAGGDDPESLAIVGNVADAAARKKYPQWSTLAASDGFVHTAPAGKFLANAFGLYDMHGNVSEWCQDWYGAEFYTSSPREDPVCSEQATERAIRGGGWGLTPLHCRSAKRDRIAPGIRSDRVGFRVARSQSAR
jgi:formylglycine-generating enzyme